MEFCEYPNLNTYYKVYAKALNSIQRFWAWTVLAKGISLSQMMDSLIPTEVCSFSTYAYLHNFKSTSHKLTELFTPYMSNKEQS